MTTRYIKTYFMISLTAIGLASDLIAQKDTADDPKPAPTQWTDADTFHLKGYDVTLSAPVLVAEGNKTDILCMPTVTKLASGDLFVVMMNQTDVPHNPVTGVTSFSSDGGLNWTEPVAFKHWSGVNLQLPSGDELILPFLRAWVPDGDVSTPYNLIRRGERKLELREGFEVTGFPEAPATLSAEGTLIGSFHFDGQVVNLKNGHYFTTLYGAFQKTGGIRIIGAESADGIHWKVVGTIAGRSGNVNERGEGPTEAALCRLKDGRLMCIYRVDNNITYGQTWSSDEGRSWTEAIECRGPMSVEPNLAVLKDGAVLLAGGRPGAKLWLNHDGTGKDWQEVDIIKHRYKYQTESAKNGDTTGYNKIALLDDTHLLYVYDYGRTPPVARVEVVRITVEKNNAGER